MDHTWFILWGNSDLTGKRVPFAIYSGLEYSREYVAGVGYDKQVNQCGTHDFNFTVQGCENINVVMNVLVAMEGE